MNRVLLVSGSVLERFCCLALLALAAIFVAKGCSGRDLGPESIVLEVGSTRVALSEVLQEVKSMTGTGLPGHFQEPVSPSLMIEGLIARVAVAEYARAKGITVSDLEFSRHLNFLMSGYDDDSFREALLRGNISRDRWMNQIRNRLLVDKVIALVSSGASRPSVKEMTEYFERHREDFTEPDRVMFRQIVSPDRELAEELRERISSGEDMARLAEAYSTGPEASEGGLVGWIPLDRIDEPFTGILVETPVGAVSSVFESPYGFHLVEVVEIRPAGVRSFPDAKEEVKSLLFERNRREFLGEWMAGLISGSKVKVHRDLERVLESVI